MAPLHRLAWIPYLWVHKVVDLFIFRKGDELNNLFPDDVAIEILVRLPAEDVLKCRRLCWQWESLTSTPYFIELHLKIATPSLFVQVEFIDNVNRLFICCENAHRELQYSEIDASPLEKLIQYKPRLVGSWNGLVLFEATLKTTKFFIINPITQEQVSVIPLDKPGKVCAIFFHPLTRDYKVLYWQHCRHQYGYCCYQYFTYAVRAQTWKEISNFSYRPTLDVTSTVILNGCLHCMVEHKFIESNNITPWKSIAIMVYRIDNEDFRALPHPGHECLSHHERMNLFQRNEQVTFCHMSLKSMVVDIWVLEDYENWGWVKRYEVHLGWMKNHYHSYSCCDGNKLGYCLDDCFPKRINFVNIQNDELLFDWVGKGVFRYHLKLKTVRKIAYRTGLARVYEHWATTVAYTKSLVSPNV